MQKFLFWHFFAVPHLAVHAVSSQVGATVVVRGGRAVVPDGVRGHSDVPVVDLTQSITSVEVKKPGKVVKNEYH